MDTDDDGLFDESDKRASLNKKTSLIKVARAVPAILVFIAVAMSCFQSTMYVRVQIGLR